MPDPYQIVDQIRTIVQSSDQTKSSLLDGLASAYSEACSEVNQRLGRCSRLLQQGLRSEAIQLAESEPKLLDASAALDFPERTTWDELVGAYGLTPATRINVEAAQQVNEAYAAFEPLRDLLRAHRRLALQRSPLRLRIAVIRQLAAQDPSNAIWSDDLRTFEQARLREIQNDAAQANRARDAAWLTKLIGELQGETWVEPPPKGLLERLGKAEAELRGQNARAALAEIANRLSDSFAARELNNCRTGRKNWEKVIATATLDTNDPIWVRVRPIFDWLDEEDRRERAIREHATAQGELCRLLDEPKYVSPAVLDRAAKGVLIHERGMLEDLQRRYIARIASAEKLQRRRFWLMSGITAGAALCFLCLLYFVVRSQLRTGEASDAASALMQFADRGDLAKAGKMLEKLKAVDPELLTFGSVIEARERYQRLQSDESDRKSRFDKALHEAEAEPMSKSAEVALQKARELARTREEQAAIEQMQLRRRTALEAERSKRDAAARPRLDQVDLAIARTLPLLDVTPLNREGILDAFQSAKVTLNQVKADLEFASDELQGRAARLGQQLEEAMTRLDTLDRKASLERTISETVSYTASDDKGRMADFARRLQEYFAAFPGEPESQGIGRTLKEAPIWLAIDAWNALALEWKSEQGGLSPAAAKRRAEQCARYLAAHPAYPGADDVEAYRRFGELKSRRSGGKDSPAEILIDLLSEKMIYDITMVTVSFRDLNGKTTVKNYYGRELPQDDPFIIKFTSILSYKGKEVTQKFPRGSLDYRGLSPQSKIAAVFRPRLADELQIAEWESLIMNLIDGILREPNIDPILQVALVREVLSAGCAGSEPMRATLESLKTRVERFAAEFDVPWMDPDDAKVEPAREQAMKFIASLPGTDQLRNQVLERRQQIERRVRRSYRSVGWLTRDQHGWQVRSVVLPPRDNLMVVTPTKSVHGEWKKIGEIIESRAKLAERGDTALIEGRPIFVEVSW